MLRVLGHRNGLKESNLLRHSFFSLPSFFTSLHPRFLFLCLFLHASCRTLQRASLVNHCTYLVLNCSKYSSVGRLVCWEMSLFMCLWGKREREQEWGDVKSLQNTLAVNQSMCSVMSVSASLLYPDKCLMHSQDDVRSLFSGKKLHLSVTPKVQMFGVAELKAHCGVSHCCFIHSVSVKHQFYKRITWFQHPNVFDSKPTSNRDIFYQGHFFFLCFFVCFKISK